MSIEFVKPGTKIDFLGKWRWCVAGSLAVILAGLIGVYVRGVRLGLDFAGGTEVQMRFNPGVKVSEGPIRAVLHSVGIAHPSVIRFGKTQDFLVRFSGGREIKPGEKQPAGLSQAAATEEAGKAAEKAGPAQQTAGTNGVEGAAPPTPGKSTVTAKTDRILAMEAALEKDIGHMKLERVDYVGPKVGSELRAAGVKSLLIAFALVMIYVAFRFTGRYAPGGVIALIHDVLVVSSIWVLLGLQFDLQVLAALLTIVGYSINDTIIIYDRIRENMELRSRRDLRDVVNVSVNQTLSRTILTSLATLLAVLALLAFGGQVVRPFALAMAFGIVVGTYSSIYIASPVMIWLEEMFPTKAKTPSRPPKSAKKRRQAKV